MENTTTELCNECEWETRKIYTQLTPDQFQALLHDSSKPHIIIKFSAPWCKPCNEIKDVCNSYFAKLHKDVIVVDINIDDTLDLYSTFKRKKMVSGIPTLLYYNSSEPRDRWFIPDDSVSGGNKADICDFFTRCNNEIHQD